MPQCRPPPHTSIHLSMSHAHQIVFNCGDLDPHGPSLPMFLPCVIQPVIQPVIHASVSHDDQNTLVSNNPSIYNDMSHVAFRCCIRIVGLQLRLIRIDIQLHLQHLQGSIDAVSRATSTSAHSLADVERKEKKKMNAHRPVQCMGPMARACVSSYTC